MRTHCFNFDPEFVQKKPTLPKCVTITLAFSCDAKSSVRFVCRNHWSCSHCSRAEGSNKFAAARMMPVGRGQKSCTELICAAPSSTARRMPGTSVILML